MSPWVLVYKFAWGILVVLVAIGLVCVFLPKCHTIRELQNKKATLQDETRELDQSIKELRTRRERFESEPAFVERVARETGMVRVDEVVFTFTNEPPQNNHRVAP